MIGITGHRSVGGFRLQHITLRRKAFWLIDVMKEFEKQH